MQHRWQSPQRENLLILFGEEGGGAVRVSRGSGNCIRHEMT
jgi:hypothetical protein